MEHFLAGPLPDHARNIMRRMGYGEIRKRNGQVSYARRVTGGNFPRYHAYVEDRNGGMQINLHIDQKEASYQGTAAHSGEYEGPLVEKEMERIVSSVTRMSRLPDPAASSQGQKKKKGFWQILTGL